MIERKHIAGFLVVLMVGLAGCSALPFMGDEQTTPTPEPNDSIAYPYGWNESGLQRFATGGDNALMQETSLTVTFERTIELENANGEFQTEAATVQVHRVNAIQENWYITSEQKQENVIQEYYLVDGTEYSRTALLYDNGSVQTQTYDSSSRGFRKLEAYQITGGEVLVLGVEFNEPTETTYNGYDALHYQVNGLENVANNSPIYTIGDSNNLTGFESDLYVSQDNGKILYVESNVYGERRGDDFRATISFEYSNFSNTSINRPDWVVTAQNQTQAGNNSLPEVINNSTSG